MNLPPERVSGYVRALAASLQALAPNDDYVPLAQGLAHLHALDPALGGDLLQPVELMPSTGMPAYAWMERARAEAVLARRTTDGQDPTDVELERVGHLDAALGQRQRARRDLYRHLRAHALLPSLRLVGALRRRSPREVALAYDRLAPDGRWVRIRVELRLGGGSSGFTEAPGGEVLIEPGLQHLLTRHFSVRLDALLATLADATGAQVRRISRGWTGPFWFPGVLPAGEVPAVLLSGLLLHSSFEVIGDEVEGERHLDPYEPQGRDEQIPEGFGCFRERRFAATGAVLEPARAWAESHGFKNLVVPVGVRRRRL